MSRDALNIVFSVMKAILQMLGSGFSYFRSFLSSFLLTAAAPL